MTAVAALLALAAAATHAYVAWDFLNAGLVTDGVIFGAMTAPYLIGAVLLAGRIQLRWTARVGIAYALLLIVVWLFEGARTDIGYATKIIEVALIAMLVVVERRAAG